jgi:hypothetical protein
MTFSAILEQVSVSDHARAGGMPSQPVGCEPMKEQL